MCTEKVLIARSLLVRGASSGASSHCKIFMHARGASSDDIFIRAHGAGTCRLFPRSSLSKEREHVYERVL